MGEKQAIEKVQNLLFPVESINIGNIVRLIIEIAVTKSSIEAELSGKEELIKEDEKLWTKNELLTFLEDLTPYQRLLLASIIQANDEPVSINEVVDLMNEILKEGPMRVSKERL